MPTDPQNQSKPTHRGASSVNGGSVTVKSRQDVIDSKTGKRTSGPWVDVPMSMHPITRDEFVGAGKTPRLDRNPDKSINNAKGGRVAKSGTFQLEKGEIIVPSRILRRKARSVGRKTRRR